MIAIAIEVDGLERVIGHFEGMDARAQDLRPAFGVVANLLELHVDRQFRTEGVQGGTPWARLATSTIRARTRRTGYYAQPSGAGVGPAGPVLQWRQRLRRSFRRGGIAHLRRITPTSLVWGSGVRYGIYHQSTAPRRRLPRRPPIAFATPFQQREILVRPLELYLQGVAPGAIETVIRARLGV